MSRRITASVTLVDAHAGTVSSIDRNRFDPGSGDVVTIEIAVVNTGDQSAHDVHLEEPPIDRIGGIGEGLLLEVDQLLIELIEERALVEASGEPVGRRELLELADRACVRERHRELVGEGLERFADRGCKRSRLL